MPNIEDIIKTTLYHRANHYGKPHLFDAFDVKKCVEQIEYSVQKPSLYNNVTQQGLEWQVIALIKFAIVQYEDAMEPLRA